MAQPRKKRLSGSLQFQTRTSWGGPLSGQGDIREGQVGSWNFFLRVWEDVSLFT